MLISKQWLSDYISLDEVTDERLEELITTRVAEIDDLHLVGAPLEVAVAAKITSVIKHPTRDNLTVCEIHDGSASHKVVCGAPNAREGLIVPFIRPGGSFAPKGTEGLVQVESRQVSSVDSSGVLASAAELQLYPDHSGLLELDDVKVGTVLSEIYGTADLAIEIDNKSLTHRPDLWCHFGFARELSAILSRELKLDPDRFSDDTAQGEKLLKELAGGPASREVKIQSGSNCRRFAALEISGVRVISSPVWMQRRLFTVGAGVRNFIVDLSNYVMCDIGQPNHAYDASLLEGNAIVARKGIEGENFLGLDGIERKLSEEDIVIADSKGAIALGGVIGGEASSVQEGTTSLFLESANFDPIVVRRMTKRHQLRTDASNRFEKSQSAHSVPLAIHRFVELLETEFGGDLKLGGLSDCFDSKSKQISVPFTFDFIRKRLGADVEDSRIKSILTGLHFQLEDNGQGLIANVPHFRATRDISIAEDLVEEIGRTFGYENIPECAPLIKSTSPEKDELRSSENQVRDEFVARGYSEISNYSFMGEEQASEKGYSLSGAVRLENSVSSEETLLRTTLIPGLISAVEKNLRFNSRFRLFELGRSYESAASGIYRDLSEDQTGTRGVGPGFERRMLGMAFVEEKDEAALASQLNPVIEQGGAFYSLFSDIKSILKRYFRLDAELKPCKEHPEGAAEAGDYEALRSWMHPYRACAIVAAGQLVGQLAEAMPGSIDGLDGRAVFAELDVERLCELKAAVTHFKPIPKYPASFFEMSVVMPKTSPYSELEELVRGSVDKAALRGLEVLSVYSGKPLAEDEKSVSIKCWLGRDDKTLDNDEVHKLQDSMMKAVEKSSFSLRA